MRKIACALSAEIRDCRRRRRSSTCSPALCRSRTFRPSLRDCRLEFVLGGGQARTPVVSFKGPALELTGQGVTNLVTSVIDYDLTLALSPALMARVPAEMRAGFKTRPDGFGTVPFKVAGTTAHPHADLAARFGKTLAIEAVNEGLLGQLFGPKKKPQ